MKTKLIIGSFLALAGAAHAQWSGSSSTTGNIYRSGNVGIGSGMTSPGYALDINGSAINDGMRITMPSTGTGGASIFLNNQNSGGHNYVLQSTGTANGQGVGHFTIYDNTAGKDRLFINSTGNVGIGTTSPYGKLNVVETTIANSTCGYFSISNTSGTQVEGVRGEADGTYTNVGGIFLGGSNSGSSVFNIGVWGVVAYATSTNNWAGYFNGRTYCPAGVFSSSDKKLKNNIQPLTGAMDKIKLLKPSTYTFKTEEYSQMGLPEGRQMGLIAQEVETIFPEIVAEVKEASYKNRAGERIVTNPDHKSINYTNLIPVLIAGIQEQELTIESLGKTIQSLQNQLDAQKQITDQLSQKSSGTTGINSINPIETGFQMSQNEPNPFTHETVVKYTLPETISNAFMAVYDLTGKQISTFPINLKGSSSITITSEKLAAGIYIYSIVADGKVVDSKRMIVAEK